MSPQTSAEDPAEERKEASTITASGATRECGLDDLDLFRRHGGFPQRTLSGRL
jgi:hypothetical protein